MAEKVTLDTVLAEITRQGIETRTRFDRIETRLDGLDSKVDAIAKDMKAIREQTANLTERVHRLEHSGRGPTA